ncbi:hypothetical protein B0H17DRAFT_1135374 [Mycena rosella]|uniref:Uncharacterized protein n=1 Tax=Mycena rosella TaxID=1033263 RepID=A0AAD7GH73_MYCRO|nr:hypothetical protein B0H17DRAFT_1135374 [Mycena rosella]
MGRNQHKPNSLHGSDRFAKVWDYIVPESNILMSTVYVRHCYDFERSIRKRGQEKLNVVTEYFSVHEPQLVKERRKNRLRQKRFWAAVMPLVSQSDPGTENFGLANGHTGGVNNGQGLVFRMSDIEQAARLDRMIDEDEAMIEQKTRVDSDEPEDIFARFSDEESSSNLDEW